MKNTLKDKVNRDKLPEHIAIIMDGNGRWATKKGNERIFGHKNGVRAVKDTVEGAAELGVNYMAICKFQDFCYDTQPGEKPACTCGNRSKFYNENRDKVNWDPSLCDYRNRETKCNFFKPDDGKED